MPPTIAVTAVVFVTTIAVAAVVFASSAAAIVAIVPAEVAVAIAATTTAHLCCSSCWLVVALYADGLAEQRKINVRN